MDYSKFARIGNQILAKFGVSATLTRKSSGTYNPATSSVTITTTTDNVKIVMFNYPRKDDGQRAVEGTAIQSNDLLVIMGTAGVTAEPQAMDNLTIGGVIYKIVTVKSHKPANEAVLYELQVRK